MERLVDDADVFVSASTQEAFGIAALKALAAGAFLVLTDIPSFREISDEFGRGRSLLVPVNGSEVQLADAVREGLARRPLERTRPASIPTWADSAARLASNFERILASRG